MVDWYEITEEQRSDEQIEECRRAYLRTFLLNGEGKKVYSDMLRRARLNDGNVAGETAAFAVLYLDRFLRETRKLCGPADVMAVRRAEARAAAMGSGIEKVEAEAEQMDGIAVDA